jgi:hypothetical protein
MNTTVYLEENQEGYRCQDTPKTRICVCVYEIFFILLSSIKIFQVWKSDYLIHRIQINRGFLCPC